MQKWSVSGNKHFQTPQSNSISELPCGTYALKCDFQNIPGGFFLDPINDFTLPKKVYGNNNNYSDLILNKFLERTGTYTTAALSGLKGSGKTLTAKEISIKAAALGISTIVINEAYSGTELNVWLQNINQPCIIFIDEFEKIYHKKDDLNQILTLLDGAYKSHKLVILTMNQPLDEKVFPYFYNRPGRVYYNINYGALSNEVITEYCNENLNDKNKLNEIISFSNRFTYFTIDILTILVQELNSHPEWDCDKVSELINIKPNLTVENISFTVSAKNTKTQTNIPIDLGYEDYIKKSNVVNIPYNFVRTVLSGGGNHFYLPIFTSEELESALAMLDNGDNSEVGQYESLHFDLPSSDDSECIEAAKKFISENPGKLLGTIAVHISLHPSNSKVIDFYQDPVTRAVHIIHKRYNIEFTITPEDFSKPKDYIFKF